MTPTDYRLATWHDIQSRLTGLRIAAYEGWLRHGPGTTREVAARCGMDLLTFRPRSTELYQMGLLEIAPESGAPCTGEGRYRALTLAQAEERHNLAQRHATAEQLPFPALA
jgi:hypothetical protein